MPFEHCRQLKLAKLCPPTRLLPVFGVVVKASWRLPLAELANSCYQGRDPVPSNWLECYLAILPKPNKTTKRPERLRPLGIQDTGMVRGRLYQQVESTLRQFPLYAYVPGRSTMDAVHRVVQHWRRVRDRHGQQVSTKHTK